MEPSTEPILEHGAPERGDPTSAAAPDGPGGVCPACGYDLRGAVDARCSECGLVIDRAALERTAIPWAYRREVGRVRAFFKTVWRVTLDLKALRLEAAKPQSARDAILFRRWLAGLVAACLTGLAGLLIAAGGIAEIVVQKPGVFAASALPGWEQDLGVPWSAGVALPGAIFAYAVLTAVVLTAAPAAIFRTAGMSPRAAEAARAIGCYAAAPLLWLMPAAAAFAALWALAELDRPPSERLTLGLAAAWILLALLALGGTVYRTGQWRARVTHGGYGSGFLAMGELLLRWVVGLAAVLFVVPWCVGFLWVVVDSFRA